MGVINADNAVAISATAANAHALLSAERACTGLAGADGAEPRLYRRRRHCHDDWPAATCQVAEL